MELVIEPDIYYPSIDDNGNYIDKIIPAMFIKKGVTCPCGSRKEKVFETSSKFSCHTKTKIHKKWLENLNENRANYYIENEKLKETVNNQRMIIARMEKEINTKVMTIDYLTMQLTNKNNSEIVSNLLDFD